MTVTTCEAALCDRQAEAVLGVRGRPEMQVDVLDVCGYGGHCRGSAGSGQSKMLLARSALTVPKPSSFDTSDTLSLTLQRAGIKFREDSALRKHHGVSCILCWMALSHAGIVQTH